MSQELEDDSVITDAAKAAKARDLARSLENPRLPTVPHFVQDEHGNIKTRTGSEFKFVPSRLPGQTQ